MVHSCNLQCFTSLIYQLLKLLLLAAHEPNTCRMIYLCVDTSHLAEGVVDWGSSGCVHRSDKWTFISVGHLICTGTSPANIHDVETWLHTRGRRDVTLRAQVIWKCQNDNLSENLGRCELTGCCGGSRAGVASLQMGGWELQRGGSSPLHQSTTSSLAGPQTHAGLPSLLVSHCHQNSSPSSPGTQMFYVKTNCQNYYDFCYTFF